MHNVVCILSTSQGMAKVWKPYTAPAMEMKTAALTDRCILIGAVKLHIPSVVPVDKLISRVSSVRYSILCVWQESYLQRTQIGPGQVS